MYHQQQAQPAPNMPIMGAPGAQAFVPVPMQRMSFGGVQVIPGKTANPFGGPVYADGTPAIPQLQQRPSFGQIIPINPATTPLPHGAILLGSMPAPTNPADPNVNTMTFPSNFVHAPSQQGNKISFPQRHVTSPSTERSPLQSHVQKSLPSTGVAYPNPKSTVSAHAHSVQQAGAHVVPTSNTQLQHSTPKHLDTGKSGASGDHKGALAKPTMSIEQISQMLTALQDQLQADEKSMKQLRTNIYGQIETLMSALNALSTGNAYLSGDAKKSLRSLARAPIEAPFYWVTTPDYESEFSISGPENTIVTKLQDFEDAGWVIPIAGSLKMTVGFVYRWGLKIIKKNPNRPQLQFGIHGLNHDKPWRLITTSRCSRSRDDDPWFDREQGDLLIDEGDVVHVQVDMRDIHASRHGTLSFAVNGSELEMAFDDIPLDESIILIPVVSMGGDGCTVEVVPFNA